MPSLATPEMHLYLNAPTVVFKARVNLASPTYPLTSIPFDTVTVGAYGDVAPDAFFVVGSADSLDDRGRGRVHNLLSATEIPVGRMSQGVEDGTLDLHDNDYITIYDDFRVHAKLPYIDPNGNTFKDAAVAINQYTTEIPPVANTGPGTAAYISGGIITVTFDGSLSYAVADGASIATYAWGIEDGTLTVGTLASASFTATFPAGFRWVSLTVVDSNGVPHSARCPVLAVNPAADVTVANFQVESQRLTISGQQTAFRLLGDAPRTTYPDGCLVMFWHGAPASPSDRSHMKLIGWHQTDSVAIRATRTGLVRDTILHCVDVAGRLDSLPGFPQALERVDPATTWEHMPGLTISKCLHYLIFWHSTALGLADFFLPPTGDDFPAMRLDSTGSSLYDQINSRALSMTPDHILCCNSRGQLSVLPDWMYMDVGDRPAAAGILTEDYWSELRFDYQRPPRVHVLRASAVVASTDWLTLGGEETLPLAFSIAPGDTFGQGVSEVIEAEGLTISQADLNIATGHRYARLNARYGPFSIVEPSGDVWDYEPALLQRIQLNISAATAAQRGLDFTAANGQVKEISLRYNTDKTGTWIAPTLVWERETSGLPATTVTPLPVGDQDDHETPPPPPGTSPDTGLNEGVEMVAGVGIDGYIYRTLDFQTPSGSGGPTWDRVDTTIADTIYSWVVDPFSPGYAPGATAGAINGWIVNDTAIYRVVDLFGSATATSVFTFPVATAGASFHWRSIQASFGAYFAAGANPWLVCVSYYGDTSGHTGTWATYSTDGGVTWAAEVQISDGYDATTPTRFNPIGVYASPKTPGLAYTAAHGPFSGPPIQWAIFESSVAATGTGFVESIAEDSDGGAVVVVDKYLWCCPPPNTKRVKVSGHWVTDFYSPVNGSCDSQVDVQDSTSTTLTHDLVHTEPGQFDTATTSGDFIAECTFPGFAGGDWPVNSSNFMSGSNSNAFRFKAYSAANSNNPNLVRCTTTITVNVTELEMDDGTVYYPALGEASGYMSSDWGASWAETALIEPGDGQLGSLHLPWPLNAAEDLAYYGNLDRSANREFRLHQSDGGVISDISPVASAINYGVNRGPFGIRTFDSNRQYLVLAGTGNDTSADPDDDLHGVFISDDYGASWTTIVTPIADSGAPAGRAAFEAAFGGDSEQILFVWGPEDYISYSDDMGATLDSKTGNLAALGASGWVGIAGGTS